MSSTKANDTAFEIDGAGPPVVLVHGMGLNRQMWAWQLDALLPHFTVIRYDLLGHGESGNPDLPCHMEHLVEQLATLAKHLELEQFGLMGFSLGGLVVRAFALAHPDRVTALAILNSAHDRDPAQRAAMHQRLQQARQDGPASTIDAALQRWFTDDFARQRPELLDQVRRWMAANDPLIYSAIYRILVEGDAELARSITAINCPTLVVACEEDLGNSPEMARRMAGLIPGARYAVVPALRHMGLVEKPAAINAILLRFLEEALDPN